MLLLLLRKKESSSFAGSSMCSNVDLSSRFLEFLPEFVLSSSAKAVERNQSQSNLYRHHCAGQQGPYQRSASNSFCSR